MRTSSKVASEKRRLTQYVTNTVLDDNFKGTTEQFVLHFNVLKNLNSQLYSTSLVLSSSLKQLVYMYLSQLMSTFTNYLEVHRSLNGYFFL